MEPNDTPGNNICIWDRIRPGEAETPGLSVAGLMEWQALLAVLSHG